MTDREGDYRPVILGKLEEQEADIILEACAGHSFPFPEFNRILFGDKAFAHPFLGVFRHLSIGHATDAAIRSQAASGGILSAVLIFLLEKGYVQGVVTLRMSRTTPWLTEPFIATCRDEVMEAAQSKYIISSVNEILPEMEAFQGELAYVGLPGQVQSIRKLQRMNHPSVRNIKFVFGPFYGNTLHFSSIRSFLTAHSETDYSQIVKLYFRYGEWPGKMRIEMKSGRVLELPKSHANYLIPFHILKNSLLCTDLTNEFTDLSGGDAWAPVYEERGKGFSMIIARSEQGAVLLDTMTAEGWLEQWPLDVEEAVRMHSHGYDLKKRGAFIRIKLRRMLGLTVPDYGYNFGRFGPLRYGMELMITGLFLVLGTKPARFLADRIPMNIMGGAFEKARRIWKNATHKIKRQDL